MLIDLKPGYQFSYRVAGIAVHKGRVLLERSEGSTLFTLPGGGVEFGENAAEALKREMAEEINAEVEVLRLPWLVESFFEYEGCQCHEIGMYFLMEFRGTSEKFYGDDAIEGIELFGAEGKTKLLFEWVDIPSLPLKEFFPVFLRTALLEIPSQTCFITSRSES
jgi:ADP-ribose pyrophosphatase YjhB (NUDIX family)